MGGVVPHGYRVEKRKLLIEPGEAEEVKLIFDLYCKLKSIPALVRELDQRGILSRVRKRSSGEPVGGITFMAGPLSHILGNRVYLGEISHRDKSYPGEHERIIRQEQFDRVQDIRQRQTARQIETCHRSGAVHSGLIYDDRGNRMPPTYVKKGSVRYHYYQSSVLADGLKSKAGL
jgi:site-specific DNA recombinase